MRLDVDKLDFACIIDALKGQLTKSQFKRAEDLVQRLLNPPSPKTANWVPMRSAWPSGGFNKTRKPNQYFHKPRTKQPSTPKAPPTADEILASL